VRCRAPRTTGIFPTNGPPASRIQVPPPSVIGVDLASAGWALGELGAGVAGGLGTVAEGGLYAQREAKGAQPGIT